MPLRILFTLLTGVAALFFMEATAAAQCAIDLDCPMGVEEWVDDGPEYTCCKDANTACGSCQNQKWEYDAFCDNGVCDFYQLDYRWIQADCGPCAEGCAAGACTPPTACESDPMDCRVVCDGAAACSATVCNYFEAGYPACGTSTATTCEMFVLNEYGYDCGGGGGETYENPGDCNPLDCAASCPGLDPMEDACMYLCPSYTVGQLCTDPFTTLTCEMYLVGNEDACPGPCVLDADCPAGEYCYPTGCAADPCDGVTCDAGEFCYGGTCFEQCPCSDGKVCYPVGPDGVCAGETLCDEIVCGADQKCHEGSCFDTCACTDPVDNTCYDPDDLAICAEDWTCDRADCTSPLCANIVCREGYKCHMGTCFAECTTNADCIDPARPLCILNHCVEDVCDGVKCPTGTKCYQGTCIEDLDAPCTSNDVCDPDSHCWKGECIPGCPAGVADCTVNGCDKIVCKPGQVCVNGSCFDPCDGATPCEAPYHCFDGHCALDSCEAKLDHYDQNHPLRQLAGQRWPMIFQRTNADGHPRPILISGGVSDWQATLTSYINAGQPATTPHRARLALFLDAEKEEYVLLLLHGHTATSGRQGSSYTIHYPAADAPLPKTPTGQVLATWGTVEERVLPVDPLEPDDGPRVHYITIESAPNQRAGVALGPFPIAEQWALRIQSAFRGGITGWDFYSGITYSDTIQKLLFDGKNWNYYEVPSTDMVGYLELVRDEELTLSPTLLPELSDSWITPEMGVVTCTPLETVGICSRGTWGRCQYGVFTCDQRAAGLAYDVCDGRDTNCDGIVDNPEKMRVHQAYLRQDNNPWMRIPTVDTHADAHTFLNFTPFATDEPGAGSTNVTRRAEENLDIFSNNLQAQDQSLLFFHRDLATGVVSMPLVHGAHVTGSEALAYGDDEPIKVRLRYHTDLHDPETFGGLISHPNMLFLSWSDDWSGPARDAVPSAPGVNETVLDWSLRRFTLAGDPIRESDSAIAQFLWRGTAPILPMEFSMVYALPSSMPYLRVYSPHTMLRPLAANRPVDVRLEPVPISQSICMSDTKVAGCQMTHYTCSAGVLSCTVTSASDCENTGCYDLDGDSFMGNTATCPEGLDCDDTNADIHPHALEACDGLDRNCDGLVDGIGPMSMNETCPDGMDTCGPAECEYRAACVCEDNGVCGCSNALGAPVFESAP